MHGKATFFCKTSSDKVSKYSGCNYLEVCKAFMHNLQAVHCTQAWQPSQHYHHPAAEHCNFTVAEQLYGFQKPDTAAASTESQGQLS